MALALALTMGVTMALSGCARPAKAPDMPRAPTGLQDRFYAPRGWTWSGLKVGDEVWRYGVASPPMVPRGGVLIVCDEHEPAEVWFETANDLIAKGYAVWVLQAQPTATPTGAVRRMVREVIRPRAGQPLVVVGDGFGADAALDGLALGRLPVDALILQRPVTEIADRTGWMTPQQAQKTAHWAVKLHLGDVKVPAKADGQAADPDLDRARSAVGGAWRRADPSLRAPSPDFGWIDRYDLTAERARAPVKTAFRLPILMADDSGALAGLCARLIGCEDRRDIGHAGQMQTDAVRGRWMAEIVALVERYRTARP